MASESSAERFLDIEGICNARQLGGYMGADGRKIRDGLLLRTAGLDKMTDETAKLLSEIYHVRYVVDFRFGYERERFPDKEIPGAENIPISLYEMDMSDPKNIEMMKRVTAAGNNEIQKLMEYAKSGQLSTIYTEILQSEQGQRGLAGFFRILLNDPGGAILWHCAHGKDRTGVAASLVLIALGVDEDVIMQDFLLSNEVFKDRIARIGEALKKWAVLKRRQTKRRQLQALRENTFQMHLKR